MKKIFSKWQEISIKHKLFGITSGLLILLAVVTYIILYNLLPYYYHRYKIDALDKDINSIIINAKSHDTESLINNLYNLSADNNLSVMLRDTTGRIIIGENDLFLFNKFNSSGNRWDSPIKGPNNQDYRVSKFVSTNDKSTPYKLDLIMPLQPINEATLVIKKIMPFILLFAVFVGMIGAFIYASTVTRPLIKIIESEREQEQRRRDFIATISHELKTPITIVSGQLEGMIYNIGKYKDRDTYLKKSYESTQELKELVNEMIEISKADNLRHDLNLKSVNFSVLLDKLVQRQVFLIENKKLKTNLKIEDNINIIADEEKIIRAINNIINNAIKYSPEGENLIIRLYKKKTGRSTKTYLEVENTGITIEEEYITEIFNPFYRIEKSRSRKTGGSGLGLYIVSNILNGHGFEYNVKNGQNSVIFTIKI